MKGLTRNQQILGRNTTKPLLVVSIDKETKDRR